MRRGIFGAAVLGLLLAASTAPALAQTTPTSGYVPPGCSGVTNLGSTAPGGTISGTIAPQCPFTGTLSMSVNGGAAGTKSPKSTGGVGVSLLVQTTTSGLLNDPVAVTLQPGTNTINATGPTRTGTVTVTGVFTVQTPGATPTASGSGGGGTAAPASTVAFTGANILRWSIAAAVLLAIGILMMWGSRRRRSTLD